MGATSDEQPKGRPPHAAATRSADPVATVTRGLSLLESGDITAATKAGRYALTLDPASPEAFFLLGVAAGRAGRADAALRLFLRATRLRPSFIEAQWNVARLLEERGLFGPAVRIHRLVATRHPTNPAGWVRMGDAYRRWGKALEATACYQEALRHDARDADAWIGLGAASQSLGKLSDARVCCEEALRLRPGNGDVRNGLGLLRRATGDMAGARAAFAAVLAGDPNHLPAMINLALLDLATGRAEAAARWCRRALALAPGRVEAWNNLGLALKATGGTERAARAWMAALVVNPGFVDALGNLAGLRRDQDRFTEAETLLRRGIRLAPRQAALHGILAYTLSGEGRLEEAERACRRALALAPALPDPLCTLGLIEQRAGRTDAVRWYDRAVATAPGHALARFNRGLHDLERGALAGGWANYSYRFTAGRATPNRRFMIPEWGGEPLAGKRLFIWREQGVGDEFLFASCYTDAIRQADHVIIECERRLVPLFARSFPRATVRAEQPVRGRGVIETVDCDLHIPAGSLPRLLRPRLADFPSRASWLFPEPTRVREWGERLDRIGGTLRVGIAWRSQIMTLARSWSYLPLDDWGAIFKVPGVTLVNLQYDDCQAEIERAEARFGVPVFELSRLDLKNDFENTAALIANLDLVIAPANSVAELASALGVPVWRFGNRDWTQLGSAVRPWYPTMRLFSPRAGAPLTDALDTIARELHRASERGRASEAEAQRLATRVRQTSPAERNVAAAGGKRATPKLN